MEHNSTALAPGELIRVQGVVQGVGFRPTVARVARAQGLRGWVRNDSQGVLIALQAEAAAVTGFLQALEAELPPLAHVDSVERSRQEIALDAGQREAFAIVASVSGQPRTEVAPDAGVCPACAAEVRDPYQRRYRYPMTNCTHCGPRYSIIQAVPYDRAHTTMAAFPMCEECRQEYEDEGDRRYHAQPVACHACGPRAWLERADGRAFSVSRYSMMDAVDAVGSLLLLGELVAIKGVGGFHLCCDATNAEAVARLRQRKQRPDKPLALMARDLEVIERYASLSDQARELLRSPAAPIVLLPADGPEQVAPNVAPGQAELGFMLPYTPLHHLMMIRVGRPIVCTSGNVSEEPQCIDNEDARQRLGGIADWLLMHDRPIANRADDSVVRISQGAPQVLRRARGYAPGSLALPPGFPQDTAVLATGAQLKNTFCLVGQGRATLSQHLGEMDDLRALEAWRQTLEHMSQLLEHKPSAVAVDMHPEYQTTAAGRALAQRHGAQLVEVQHHHAHIAACMAENRRPLHAPPVLGIALDGLGYGEGGQLWGGEFLVADYRSYTRAGTFKPVAMLGGDAASREPWRNLYAHLMAEIGWGDFSMNFGDLPLHASLAAQPRALLDKMLAEGVNAPLASSCGRLFDAVAAALELCPGRLTFEGQAAMALEALVTPQALEQARAQARGGEIYPMAIPRLGGRGLPYIEPMGMWRALLGDLWEGSSPALIAARFHVGLADAIVRMAQLLRGRFAGLETVALSGGCWQNQVLQALTREMLESSQFQVITHRQIPANDGGVSLGQAMVALARSAPVAQQESASCV